MLVNSFTTLDFLEAGMRLGRELFSKLDNCRDHWSIRCILDRAREPSLHRSNKQFAMFRICGSGRGYLLDDLSPVVSRLMVVSIGSLRTEEG